MLTEDGEPTVESLPLLAAPRRRGRRHRAMRASSRSTPRAPRWPRTPPRRSSAPSRWRCPLATSPQDRVTLLSLRDDAMDMLRRPHDRLEGLAELAALADALGDPHLELDVMLRRAAALRLAGEEDRAANWLGGSRRSPPSGRRGGRAGRGAGARAGAGAHRAGRGIRSVRRRGRPRRGGGGVRAGRRACRSSSATSRRTGGGEPRARVHPGRAGPGVVRRTGQGGRAHPDPGQGRWAARAWTTSWRRSRSPTNARPPPSGTSNGPSSCSRRSATAAGPCRRSSPWRT